MANKSSLKKKISDMIDEEFSQESKSELYTSSYNIPFDVEEFILNDLKTELESYGLPSISKVGVGLTFARSLPYTNGNGLGITAKCIKNSLDTGRFSRFDFAHNTNEIMGNMINLKIYDDTNELIPEKPMRIFGLGVLQRDSLNTYGINPENLPNWGTSLELRFGDFDFWYKGQIILKENANPEWLLHVDDIVEGIPYYWENSRVCIIAGGVNEDAKVDFNGNALTMNPADKEAGILLAVAEHKYAYPIFVLNSNQKQNEEIVIESEGEKMFRQFETEADLNAFISQIKNDYKTELKFDELQANLQTVNASILEKDNLLKESNEKLIVSEASLKEMTTRAETAEGELNKQAQAKLVETRKQALASKNYDVDEDDLQFIATASEDDFTKFVKKIEKAQASVKNHQATASQQTYEAVGNLGIGLTGDQNTETNNTNTETKNETISIFN